MNKPSLEVCVFSAEAALAAQNAGADRVELCSSYIEGGLTPSAGTIRMTRKLLNIECFVMIRPRGGDFYYSEKEFELMHRDIEYAKSCGVDGVVLGALQANGHVNISRTRELVQHASPLKVCFHRAFDLTKDPLQALEDVIVCGCCRILTSGQKETAIEGLDTISKLAKLSAGRVQIMAGSGVNPKNARKFIAAGVHALHFSAKTFKESKMKYRKKDVAIMQTGKISDYQLIDIDEIKIMQMRKELG